MTHYKVDSIKVSGIAACVPAEIEYTRDYTGFEKEEAADFEKRVGVRSKRNSKGKYTTSDLCLKAAQKLIEDLKWKKEEIGLLLFVSQTPDYAVPATSIILQDKLGLSKSAIALDIRLGCTGWVMGLSVAGSLMKSFNIKRSLLLVGETSILSSFDDKSTYPLMGDAGTATGLEIDHSVMPLIFNSLSDGAQYDSIIAAKSGARHISKSSTDESQAVSFETRMNGSSIFEFSSAQVLPSIKALLDEIDAKVEDIDYFIFHQANRLIIESLRKKLNIPEEKCLYSIRDFGNTSSASIPLTILYQKYIIGGGLKCIFCSSFGVGLSLANAIIEVTDLYCSDLIEI